MTASTRTRSTRLAGLIVAFAAIAGSAREPIAKAYSPLDASREAYARSEQARLHSIDRQRQANALMSWYGTLGPSSYPLPPDARGWAAGRRYERALGRSPLHLPFPASPGLAYPSGRAVVPTLPYFSPSPPPVEQPLGHKKTWTGPNSYVYQPLYESDLDQAPESILAEPPQAPVPEAIPVPSGPVPAPAPVPSEMIPTPPAMPETIPTPMPQ